MKAEELMIGDWIRIIHHHSPKPVIRVKQVELKDYNDALLQVYPSITYDPIPLTKEVLEYNGFELDYNKYYMELKNGPYTVFQLEPYYNYDNNGKPEFYGWSVLSHFRMILRYVHELQHLYKLMNTQLDDQEVLSKGIKLSSEIINGQE